MSGTTLVQKSWISEIRALLAVARREWITFRRYPSWVVSFAIWPLLLPMGYIFAAKALGGPDGASLTAFDQLTGTTDYVAYVVVGTTLWMWLNVTLWDVGFFLRNEQMWGTLESNWLCPTGRISIMAGACLTKLLTSLLRIAFAVVEFKLFFGVDLVRGDVGLLLLIFLLAIPSIYGLGLAFASLVIRFREANAMVFLVRGVFMIFCGITYPLAVLPEWMRGVASLLPLTYAIQGTRAVALAGATVADVLPDLLMLGVCALVMPALGYVAFRLAEQRSRRIGVLAQY